VRFDRELTLAGFDANSKPLGRAPLPVLVVRVEKGFSNRAVRHRGRDQRAGEENE
jgi:hypothetical protein